jgi:hypothetical protein
MAGTGNGGINELIPWYQQKTTWTAVTAVIGAIAAYFTNEISLVAALGTILAALAVVFGRQGIEKSTYIPKLKDCGEEVDQS